MKHAFAEVSFLVREYDEAIAFFTQALLSFAFQQINQAVVHIELFASIALHL